MNKAKIIFGILTSAFFIYLALHKINWQEVSASFSKINYIFLLPVPILTILNMWIRAYRWSYLVLPIKKLKVRDLFAIVSIGFMINALLPARFGDLSRAYVLGEKENLSKISSLGTIVIERLIDVFSFLFLFFLTISFFPFPSWMIKAVFLTVFISIIVIISLFILRRFNFFRKFNIGLKALSSPRVVLKVCLSSVVILSSCILMIQFTSRAFGLSLSLIASTVVFLILTIGLMIPSAPGFIGSYQFFIVTSLGLFGVNKNLALSFSLVLQAAQYIPIFLLGYLFFWHYGFSLKRFNRQIEVYTNKLKI